jgi:hypothetical protein
MLNDCPDNKEVLSKTRIGKSEELIMKEEQNHNGLKSFDLPPADTERWVKSRKMAVIDAIHHGVLTEEQACNRYNLSMEELESWKHLLKRHGPDALRTTHLKRYRKAESTDNIYHLPKGDGRAQDNP